MPCVAGEPVAVRLIGVIEARVLGFLRAERSVERLGLMPHLGDNLALEELLEIARVRRFGRREHALVHELIDGPTLHPAIALGRSGAVGGFLRAAQTSCPEQW